MHSAWIGEHHFDRLGVNSRPDILLASIIPETERLRLAPAVNVLPLHHPIHVAEIWATLDLISGGRLDVGFGRPQRGNVHDKRSKARILVTC